MIGITVRVPDPAIALELIVQADSAGIEAVWLQAGGLSQDPLTLFGAAAVRTSRVHLGSAIVPTWPRHPLVLAQQALVLEALAPGRVTLGVGPSTAGAMRAFGADFRRPLSELREFLTVLRGILATGRVDVTGEFVSAHARLEQPLATPVMASALQENAFELCGELADGAITWLCPPAYVTDRGIPAVARGAARSGRTAPPVVLHVPICQATERGRVIEAASRMFGRYTQYQFYRDMFAAAGHPPGDQPRFSGELVDALVVYGSDDEIRRRLKSLARVFEHLMVTPIPLGEPVAAVTDAIPLVARL